VTIRNHLTFLFTAMVSVLMLISSIMSWLGMREHLYNSTAREVQQKAQKVQELIDALALEHEKHQHVSPFQQEAPKIVTELITEEGSSIYHGSFVQLSDTSGQIYARSPNLGNQSLPHLKPEQPHQVTISLPSHPNVHTLYYSLTVKAKGRPIGTVQVAQTLTEMDHVLEQLIYSRALELIVVVLISLLLGQWLSRRALAPMVALSDEVRNMAGLSPHPLEVAHMAPSEVKQLADTFNGLLERMEEAFIRQKRFVSDASHELRSPLTVIRGHAQLLRKRGRTNPELFEESVENIVEEADRLERLITDMLLLAYSQELPGERHTFDLAPLLQQVYDELSPLYPQLKLDLAESPLLARGEPDSVKRVVLNLADNALRLVNNEGRVQIGARPADEWVELTVTDNGPGIEAQHIPYLFDRFYRIDHARNRSGGSGLGLAISKELVEKQGGDIRVSSQPGKGTRFVVRLVNAEKLHR
jgi:heavy metal sensor kinase